MVLIYLHWQISIISLLQSTHNYRFHLKLMNRIVGFFGGVFFGFFTGVAVFSSFFVLKVSRGNQYKSCIFFIIMSIQYTLSLIILFMYTFKRSDTSILAIHKCAISKNQKVTKKLCNFHIYFLLFSVFKLIIVSNLKLI